VIESVPLATHNQRGIGTLQVGRTEGSGVEIDARELLHIVEGSMSSEIYELMKRSDERAVVEKAHANPRFVEDCVREMVRRVSEAFPELGDGAFVHARQENLETIHRHNVIAERYGLISEITRELESGEHSRSHTTMREWLEAPASQL
jgi:GTP cyclohydrolase IV